MPLQWIGSKNQENDFASVDLQRLWSLDLGEKERPPLNMRKIPQNFTLGGQLDMSYWLELPNPHFLHQQI